VAKQAKDRAAELPDDLMGRVHQATRRSTTSRSSSGSTTRRSSGRTRSQGRRRAQTSSAR
jgi:hypothetical protein